MHGAEGTLQYLADCENPYIKATYLNVHLSLFTLNSGSYGTNSEHAGERNLPPNNQDTQRGEVQCTDACSHSQS